MLENCFYIAVSILTVAVMLLLILFVMAGIFWCVKRFVYLAIDGIHKILCRHGYHYVEWYGHEHRYYCVYCHEKFHWMKNVETDKYAYFNDKTGKCCHHIKEV